MKIKIKHTKKEKICTDLITIYRERQKNLTYINITVKIYMYITENKLQYDMHRLVEVKYRPLIYNALCVVTHAVIKKNYIVQKCYNK